MFKKILIGLLVIFIIMQFFRPEKNISETTPKTDFIVMNQPPEKVANLLKTSCYDCHSNNTNYPWYSNVAPISYFLANHVKDGKKHLNFSEWGNYNEKQKSHALEEIGEEVEERHMPLKSYLSMHDEATVSDDEIKALTSWIQTKLDMASLYEEKPQ